MANLEFTVSLSRAGKSTYAQNTWITDCPYDHGVVINSDDIRIIVNNGKPYSKDTEAIVWSIVRTTIKGQLLQSRRVLFDETNTSVQSLKNIFEIDSAAQPIYIDTPVEVCIERAQKLGQECLVEPIKRMNENLRHLCWLAKKDIYVGCEIVIGAPTKKLVLAGIEVVREQFKRERV